MSLVCPQRDAIESLLCQSGIYSSHPVTHRARLEDGRNVFLLGVSRWANGRSDEWRNADVAVFGTQPPAKDPVLPSKLTSGGRVKVVASVLLESRDQDVSNEMRVTLLEVRDGIACLRPGHQADYRRTIC